MIRKILYSILMATGFIILTSKSCGPDDIIDKEARLKEKQDSMLTEIKDDFASEYLFEERLMAYGEKAKQKLFDFADYLGLYSDKDMDTLFRRQVRDMMGRIFYNEDPVVQWSVVAAGENGKEKDNLADLLVSIDASTYKSMEFKISDVRTLEPLHRESAEQYVGIMGCSISISGMAEKDTTLIYRKNNLVRFITTRTSKQFGADTSLLIWQVFLDEIGISQ